MLSITNAAVIGLGDDNPKFSDLKAKLDLQGKHKNATVKEILPTPEDEDFLMESFVASIC